jgi:hypothetical protein
MRGGLTAQGYFRAVHAKHQRIAARRAMRHADPGARQKTELHQPLGIVGRKIQLFQNRFFALLQIYQCGWFFDLLSQTSLVWKGFTEVSR